MLTRLSIRDIVLIDRLDLDLAGGLSVLTGETGAGKSILLDAMALALGARGDASLVRSGQDQGQVTAVFEVSPTHAASLIAKEAGIEVEGDLILRRIQWSDGRTRALVNDQVVSVQILKAIGAALVEIHGQHADRALIDVETHRALLDQFGGLGADADTVAACWRDWRKAIKALDEAKARIETIRKEGDFLRHAVDELGKLSPDEGEEEALASRRQGMMQAEKIADDLNEAAESLSGNTSALPSLISAWRKMERRVAQAPHLMEPIVKAMGEAIDQLENARMAVESAQREAAFNPRELEEIEERLFALRAASRKFAVPVDGLNALCARYQSDLAALDAGETAIIGLEKAMQEAESRYKSAADRLSAKRQAVADGLDKAVNAELPPLKLERARFMTQHTAASPSADGTDTLEFWVETNPGTKPGPMMKVASGGELSRFMLALKVVLADRASAPTLVFDEIDSGVGGAVSDAIGQRLARLAKTVQVLSVTHAPQVAARSDHHLLIAKTVTDGKTATTVTQLSPDHRHEELARMLAGEHITDEARAAAKRLLNA